MRNHPAELHLPCACYSPFHQANIVYWDNDPDFPFSMYISTPARFSFWRRLKTAVKYLFFGGSLEFEDIELTRERALELNAFLTKALQEFRSE